MYKIIIDDLEKEVNKTIFFNSQVEIKEFDDCKLSTDLEIKSLGDFIEIKGKIWGKLKLECDRCLSQFEYELDLDIDETYAKKSLYDEYAQEVELKSGQFVIDLDGAKEINIYDLLYQSVILNLPNKKVCGINCNEGLFVSDENMKIPDSRMDVFKNIKIEKN